MRRAPRDSLLPDAPQMTLVQRLRWHARDRSNLYIDLTAEAAREIERLQRDLLQAYLLHVYKPDGVDIWLADAKKKGLTLEQQLQRAEQLVTGAFV